MSLLTGWIGTYASPQSRGVYRFTFDPGSGALTEPELFHTARDAKCLALDDGGVLAAPFQGDRGAGVVLLDASGAVLASPAGETATSCHLAFQNGVLYAANYHDGTVSLYRRDASTPVQTIRLGREAGCHQILFHRDMLLVPCLELDAAPCFRLGDLSPAGTIPFPAGSGPRHGVFDRAHRRFWMVTERSSQLFAFRVSGDQFRLKHTVPILPGHQSGQAAAVRLSEDERFLYVSVRGVDQIAVFRLDGLEAERVQLHPSGGRHPRDFLLAPGDRFLLALNRDAGGLTVFSRDPGNGLIGAPVAHVPIAQGSALILSI